MISGAQGKRRRGILRARLLKAKKGRIRLKKKKNTQENRKKSIIVPKEENENGKTKDTISREGEFIFPPILHKNHAQTSRKKFKEHLLTEINRKIKRSQSCKKGG